ncbi:hypothetical protein ACET5F_32130 [Pseudomonas aeruginosa]
MIKFEIKDRKTGKTESYTKEDVTMGEAEKCYGVFRISKSRE